MRLCKYRVQKYVSKLDVFFCTVNGEKVSSRSRKAHTHTGWVSLCSDKIHCLKPQPERQLENWKFPTCKLRLPCEMTKPLFFLDRFRECERFSANFVQHSTRLLYLLPSSSPRRKLFHFIFISLYIWTERSERDEWMKTKFLALLMEEKKKWGRLSCVDGSYSCTSSSSWCFARRSKAELSIDRGSTLLSWYTCSNSMACWCRFCVLLVNCLRINALETTVRKDEWA